jgi:ABC-type branched-subunit amino acid transport system substrate-binding protein
VKGRIAQINKSGGIDGHPIRLSVCNDGADPNQAAACARSAVANKDVAVIGGQSNFADNITPVLSAAHIPWVGNGVNSPSDGTSSVSFPSEGSVLTLALGTAKEAVATGCKKLGVVVLDYSTAIAAAKVMEEGMKALGGSYTDVQVPVTGVANYSSQIATLNSAGAKCLSEILPPTAFPQFVQANAQSGTPLPIVLPSSDASGLSTIGTAGNGIHLVSDFYYPSDPSAKALRAWVSKNAPGVTVAPGDLGTLSGTYVLQAGLQKAAASGAITSSSVLSALGSLTNVKGLGVTPPISTTTLMKVPGYTRVFTPWTVVYTLKNGQVVRSGNFVSLNALANKATAGSSK